MPALAASPVRTPRLKPNAPTGSNVGAGVFSKQNAQPKIVPATSLPTRDSKSGCEHNETLRELVHDARNVLAGLTLYCDLLAAPGVLASEHHHYAPELASIAQAAGRILEKMAAHTSVATHNPHMQLSALDSIPASRTAPFAPALVQDAASEVRGLRPLLAAIAGSTVRLAVDTMPCPGATRIPVEDLARVLVNLVRNAADAMPAGGYIRVAAQYGGGFSFVPSICGTPASRADKSVVNGASPAPQFVLITVADNGPGVPAGLRERVFDSGFSTHEGRSVESSPIPRDWPAPRRRGLGLAIVRNLVESAGGSVRVAPRSAPGACFEITLPILRAAAAPDRPITSGIYPACPLSAHTTDLHAKGSVECL